MTASPKSAVEAAAKALDDDEVNVWATSSDRAARIAVAAAAPEIARAAKAEALREFIGDIEDQCPHEADSHGEGNCEVCDYAFALQATAEERADEIEASR